MVCRLLWLSLALCGATGWTSNAYPRHDFYLSHTSIRHRPERRGLDIYLKAFTDDLLVASGGQFEAYLWQHFRIWINGELQSLRFSHFRYENDLTWLYFSIEEVCEIRQIRVWNSLLTDLIDEQTNIVRIRIGEETRVLNLTKSLPDETLKW